MAEKRGLFRTRQAPLQVTNGPLSFHSPVPSLDGKKLYVVGSQPRGELARFDRQTKQFAPYLAGISAEDVSFSRDGGWVAYVAFPEGTLWRSNLAGTERVQAKVDRIIPGRDACEVANYVHLADFGQAFEIVFALKSGRNDFVERGFRNVERR